MAREVESFHQFKHQSHKYGLPKDVAVVRCDDGAVYEFERADDGPDDFRLVARFQPDGHRSLSNGVLPASVRETVDSALPGWFK